MKFERKNLPTLIAGVFAVFSLSVFTLAAIRTAPGPEPVWVEHYRTTARLKTATQYHIWDREAKTVFNEASRYGGKVPPRSVMYGLTYPSCLREIASGYKSTEHWDDAETFYRKAFELETLDEATNSCANPRLYASDLISLLKLRGKNAEALELQKQQVAKAEQILARDCRVTMNAQSLYREQATAAEMEGKMGDAEAAWKKFAYADTRFTSNVANSLEPLADFYARQKNYEGGEKTLTAILTLKQTSLPAGSPNIAPEWERLTRFYVANKKFDKAENSLKQTIRLVPNKCEYEWKKLARLYENQNRHEEAASALLSAIKVEESKLVPDKEDIASLYIWYSNALQTAGKPNEAAAAKAKAHLINPEVNDTIKFII